MIDERESIAWMSMMTVPRTSCLLLRNRSLALLEWPNSGGVVKVVTEVYLEGGVGSGRM